MKKGFGDWLLESGAKAVGRAAGVVLSDPRGQEAMARAVGLAQRGLELLGSAQERAFHAAGLAARPDYDELRKQVARLKRKAREVSQQLDAASRGGAAPTSDPGAGRDGSARRGSR